jgi:hypothetical protein
MRAENSRDISVGRGVDLFQAVCQRDLQGIVAKAAHGLYQPEKTGWVKIKNPNYCGPQRLFRCSPKTCLSDLEKLRARLARMSDEDGCDGCMRASRRGENVVRAVGRGGAEAWWVSTEAGER